MKVIPLTNSTLFAFVDDEDFEKVSTKKWFLCKVSGGNEYARSTKGSRESGGQIYLHHFVFGKPPKGMETDHRNTITLDCQKQNLRFATVSQNQQNQKSRSGLKGVTWHKPTKKWRAQIRINKIKKHLGLFTDVLVAARAYDRAAKQYHGEFARINGV